MSIQIDSGYYIKVSKVNNGIFTIALGSGFSEVGREVVHYVKYENEYVSFGEKVGEELKQEKILDVSNQVRAGIPFLEILEDLKLVIVNKFCEVSNIDKSLVIMEEDN